MAKVGSSIHWLINKLVTTIQTICSASRPCYGAEEDMSKLKMVLLNVQLVLKDAEKRARSDDSVDFWLKELENVAFVADDVLGEYEYDLLRYEAMERAATSLTCNKKQKGVAWDPDHVLDNYETQHFLKEKTVEEASHKRERKEEEKEVDDFNSSHKKLKHMACDGDDALDLCERKVLIPSKMESTAESHKRKREKEDEEVCDVVTTFTKLSITDGMADRIGVIVNRLTEIATHQHALNLMKEDITRNYGDEFMNHHLNSYSTDLCIYGREHDKEKIIELLFSDFQSNFNVIPIVGMNGIGKTTLAQFVYTDKMVCQFFDLRVWVHMLESFHVQHILKAIIESFGRKPCHSTELNTLQNILQQEVRGKRVLLVLDDLCDYKHNLWGNLRISFTSAQLVQIIITTRTNLIGKFKMSLPPHHVHCLNEDQSQLIFQHSASNIDTCLHEIGKKMVNKCNGLPLSLKLLGNLLGYETDKARWVEILESEIWDEDESSCEIPAAIKISYYYMPRHLKPCFAYCSLFPKGYKFSKDKLVMFWMAQGFIQQKGSTQMEEIGSQYFNELLQRSLFQNAEVHGEGDVHFFIMHNLIHDLAQFVSGKECTIRKPDDIFNLSNEVHHLRINTNQSFQKNAEPHFNNETKTLHLRSFLYGEQTEDCLSCDGDGLCMKILQGLGHVFGSIRVLELKSYQLLELPDSIGYLKHIHCLRLENSQIKKLPESISQLYKLQVLDLYNCQSLAELPKETGNLVNLRYLSCCGSDIQRLPGSVCQLYNLQTLDLQQCMSLTELPKSIGNLSNLQHLKLSANMSICMPSGIRQLTDLQTLEQLRVMGDFNHCGIDELKYLMNLRGKLCISGLKNMTKVEDAIETDLKSKKHIAELRLDWTDQECHHKYSDSSNKVSAEELDEGVLEGLQPNANLTSLEIHNYGGARFPRWFGDPSFTKLTAINISHCNNGKCKFLPTLGQLPSLRSLVIQKMHGVLCVGREFCCNFNYSNVAFPSLIELRLSHLYGWEDWCGVMDGDFPVLRQLTIEDCPRLKILPPFTSLSSLFLWGLDELTTLPNLSNMVALEHLTLKHCPELVLSLSDDKLPPSIIKTQDVNISDCPGLHEWRFWHRIHSKNSYNEGMMFESKFSNETLF